MRKITITVDESTIECLRAFREFFGIPYSAAIRRAVWAYYQDKFSIPPAKSRASIMTITICTASKRYLAILGRGVVA